MNQNNLEINPYSYYYNGIREREVNFLQYCIAIHMTHEPNCNIGYLIDTYTNDPDHTYKQLIYYATKWYKLGILVDHYKDGHRTIYGKIFPDVFGVDETDPKVQNYLNIINNTIGSVKVYNKCLQDE